MWWMRQYRQAESMDGAGGGGTAAVAEAPPSTEPSTIVDSGHEPAPWYQELSEHRTDPAITRYASLDAFVKSHKELERKLGDPAVIPAADADADAWTAFYQKMPGYPEQAKDYQLEMPPVAEGMPDLFPEERMQAFLARAHQNHLTQSQVQNLLSWFAETETAAWQAMQETDSQARTTGYEALKAQWGTMTDHNLAVAMEGLRREFGPGNLDWADTLISKDAQGNGQLVGNLPQFNQIVYEWAMSKGYGRFVPGGPGGPVSRDAAQAELDQARADLRAQKITPQEFDHTMRRLGPILYSGDDAIFSQPLTASDVS